MRPRLAQIVAEQISEMIITTPLSVGEKLATESELASAYSVSRSTVREAMKILQAENIVEIRHGLGSFVAANTGLSKDPLGLSFEDQSLLLPDLMELRLLMEPGIAELSAKRRTENDLRRMEESLRGMMEAHHAGEDYHSYDYVFHIALARSTHNSVLRRIFPVIFEAIERGYAKTSSIQGSFNTAMDYHRRIFAAIRDGDGEEAGRLTRQHILQAMSDINAQTKGA